MSRTVVPLLWGVLLTLPSSLAAQSSAGEILDAARAAYAELDRYRDVGEIEEVTAVDGVEQASVHYFETVARPPGFLWRLRSGAAEGVERVFWRDGGETRAYDGALRQVRPLPSLAAELANRFGPTAPGALAVPLAVAGERQLLAGLGTAVVEGVEACGAGADCHVLSIVPPEASTHLRVWIDLRSLWVRQVESIQVLQLEGAGHKTYRHTLRVRHRPRTLAASEDAEPPYRPPAFAESVTEWRLPFELVGPGAGDAAVAGGHGAGFFDGAGFFYDEITVQLLTVPARVFDRRGKPITDLGPEDLIVRVGDTELPVVGVDWHGPAADAPSSTAAAGAPAAVGDGGRSIVIFLQNDLEPSRVRGQLGLLPRLQELVRGLPPADRVAVLSYFRHLTLWHDFTRDRQAVAETLERAVMPGARPRELGVADGWSLASALDARKARRAATVAAGLTMTAEALASIPGEKQVVLAGFGVGDPSAVARAMVAAGAAVFVLDVCQADFHSMAGNLEALADITGGSYSSTFLSRAGAIGRVERMLAGYSAIAVDASAMPARGGLLKVRLRGRAGSVFFRQVRVHLKAPAG